MKTNFLVAFVILMSTPVLAITPDHQLPISINADNTQASIRDNTAVYVDNVEVRQGSLLIKASRLEINASAGKGNEVFIFSGSPVTYSQLLEGERPVTAQANEIRYDIASRTLTLTTDAELTQSGSLVRGDVIRYNLERQELTAGSEQNRRVTTIFTPETKENP